MADVSLSWVLCITGVGEPRHFVWGCLGVLGDVPGCQCRRVFPRIARIILHSGMHWGHDLVIFPNNVRHADGNRYPGILIRACRLAG